MTGRIPLKDSANRRRLVRGHCKFHGFDDRSAVAVAFGLALDRHPAISEDSTSGVKATHGLLLDAPEGSLRQVFQVERIDDSMCSDQNFRLLTVGVNALGDKDNADARELELLENTQRVRQLPAEAACIVYENYIEGPRLLLRYGKKSLQTSAVIRRA